MVKLKLTALNKRAKKDLQKKVSKTETCAMGCDWGCSGANSHR